MITPPAPLSEHVAETLWQAETSPDSDPAASHKAWLALADPDKRAWREMAKRFLATWTKRCRALDALTGIEPATPWAIIANVLVKAEDYRSSGRILARVQEDDKHELERELRRALSQW